jgi:cation:H+ antiporter
MLLPVAAVVVGLVVLIWSADRLVLAASATANDLGVSPLLIGLVIVGLATSSPEILVAGFAAWQGNPGLGIGNAVGSNIANIALILGASALVAPIAIHSRILTREVPILFAATAVAVALMLDGSLGRLEGLVLLVGMALAIALIVRQAIAERNAEQDPLAAGLLDQIPTAMPLPRALAWLAASLLLLLASSRLLVWGGVDIAQMLGISDVIIGLTIVAIGTSLPELAAAIASVLKREPDLVLGNVIGSNLFNTLAVLGVPAMIRPGEVPGEVLTRDLPVMSGVTLLLLPVLAHRRGRPGRISRLEGAFLLTCFIAYQGYLLTRLYG